MLLVTIEKLETNPVLVNMNELKPYKYMEFEVPKKKQQMPIYWEQSVGGVQVVTFDIEEDNDECQIQKPQMKNDEDEKQIIDLAVNIIFIFDLQMSNNCSSVGFGMERSKDDMSKVFAESTVVFAQSLGTFA